MYASDKRGVHGFTLIEMMIVIAILAIFMVFVFTNILNTRRISTTEDVRLDMDRVGNQVLRTLSQYAKDAVLPVRQQHLSKNSGITGLVKDNAQGFGKNAEDWEQRLAEGANFLAFCIPVDADGSGDCLDGDMLPYLGISHPLAFSFQDASGRNKSKNQITDAEYDANFSLTGSSVNPGLAALHPDTLQAKDAAPTSKPPAPTTLAVPDGAYAIVRFEPLLRTDGNPVIVHEGVDAGGAERGLHCDINGDGRFQTAQRYYIGNLEIHYPAVNWTDPESGQTGAYPAVTTRLGTMDRVAIPVQQVPGQANWEAPIFTLVSMNDDGGLTGSKAAFDSLRIMLTLVNYHDRDSIQPNDPDHPGGSAGRILQNKYWQTGTVGQLNNVIAKRYEAVVRLRNL